MLKDFKSIVDYHYNPKNRFANTPLTIELASSQGVAKDYFFRALGCLDKNIPEYRVLKDLICQNNSKGVYDERLIKKLEEIEPLAKDLYELDLMSKSEYEKLRLELTPIITNKN